MATVDNSQEVLTPILLRSQTPGVYSHFVTNVKFNRSLCFSSRGER